MNTKHLLAAIATTALVTGGQAIAQGRGGGHGGGMGGGMGAGASGNAGATQAMDARAMSNSGTEVAAQSRGRGSAGTNHDPIERLRSGSRRSHRDRSQARDHANDAGVENSNENSVLHDETTTTPSTDAAVDTDTATPAAVVETRTDARANSQGPANASPTGVTNSNENSVLHDSSTTTTATTPPTENQPAGTTGIETRTDARANSRGPANASPTGVTNSNENSVLHDSTTTTTTATPPTENQPAGTTGVETRTDARANSQGPANASPTGVANSNENSVLHDAPAPASNLAGLRTGLVVRDSSGTQIGTVSRIVTTPDGRIQNVLVTSADRRTIRLAPGALSLSGDVVTTTSVGGPDPDSD